MSWEREISIHAPARGATKQIKKVVKKC